MDTAAHAKRHLIVSALLYYAAFCATLFGVVLSVFVVASALPGWWSVGGGLVTLVVAASIALAGWNWLRRTRSDRFYRLHFPGYAGEQFYAGTMHGVPGDHHRVADGGEALFVIAGGKSDAPHEQIGGKMVSLADGSALAIRKADAIAVRVHELTDEEIKAATRNADAGWSDRAIEQGVARMLGQKVSHKITPFAAYVQLLHSADGAISETVWAIRTDVPAGAMRTLGAEDNSDIEALVKDAAKRGVAKVQGELRDTAGEFVHDKATDLMGEHVVGAADTLSGLHHDIASLASLGSVKVGPTNGARGRLYARLVAERLRAACGLPEVEIVRAAG